MNAFKADINESAKIISGQNEKDKEPTYKRRRHESIDSQESIPNKPKKSRKDSNSEGQKADSNPEGQKADSNPEEDREEDMEEKTGDENDQEKKDSNLEEDREEGEKNVEEKTGDGDDQEKKDSNLEEDREEDVEEKTGDEDDHKHDDKLYIDEDNGMETGEENLDETAAEIDAVQKITAKSSNDEDHDTSIN